MKISAIAQQSFNKMKATSENKQLDTFNEKSNLADLIGGLVNNQETRGVDTIQNNSSIHNIVKSYKETQPYQVEEIQNSGSWVWVWGDQDDPNFCERLESFGQ